MDMRKRVRCMMSECFHQCQPAPSFQAVFTLAQSHYQWDPGWGVTENQLPFFLVGE